MSSGAKVFPIPPPLYFLAAFGVGWLLHLATDDHIGGRPATIWLGVALLVAGVGLDVWATITFRRARTTFIPWGQVSAIVTSGPFRFSRNPMYVGMTLSCIGGALLIDSWWPILMAGFALALVRIVVVAPEEEYLSREFSTEYGAYRARVRRWL
jgi:protein-S-isoprenylcysteine O-methyltransferase Ste14